MTGKCSRCGGESRQTGKLEIHVVGMVLYTGKLHFVPDRDERSFTSLETKNVGVSAEMCADCGNMALIGDVAKLRRIAGE